MIFFEGVRFFTLEDPTDHDFVNDLDLERLIYRVYAFYCWRAILWAS